MYVILDVRGAGPYSHMSVFTYTLAEEDLGGKFAGEEWGDGWHGGVKAGVVAAEAAGTGCSRDGLRVFPPRRSRRAGQSLGVAVSGVGNALHVQFADLRPAVAGDLHEPAGSGGGGVVAVRRAGRASSGLLRSFRGSRA